MIKVAIVILNWNGEHFLKQFLPNILQNSTMEGAQVVVVDNNSTDNSIHLLKTSFPDVKLIVFNKNYGYAGGYHKALDQIEAEYYVLLNSDVEVSPNWLQPVLKMMDNQPEIGAAMPKIKAFHNRNEFEYAGAAGGFIDKYGYPFCQGRVLSYVEEDHGQFDQQREIFWASGACMFVRASAYFEAEGLDPDFFAHMEEIDLCWRLKRCGFKVYYCPESTVYHVGGGTLPNDNPRKLTLNYRNSLYLIFKNAPPKKFKRLILGRLLLDGLSAMVYLTQFKLRFIGSVLRAHIQFFRAFPTLRKKRNQLKSHVRTEEISQIYQRSIAFSFLVKKKKTFEELNF